MAPVWSTLSLRLLAHLSHPVWALPAVVGGGVHLTLPSQDRVVRDWSSQTWKHFSESSFKKIEKTIF